MCSSRNITFIGTFHRDVHGYSKLMDELNKLHPELIIIEVSLLSVILRRTYTPILKCILRRNLKLLKPGINPEIRYAMAYLDLPFEYTAARDYCRRSDVKYILADISFYTLLRFIHAHKLITKKNLLALSETEGDSLMREKTDADNIFSEKDRVMLNIKLQRFRKDPFAVRREKILLKRLNRYASKHSDRNIVYIGGWEHLIDDPQRMLLYSACDFPGERLIIFT